MAPNYGEYRISSSLIMNRIIQNKMSDIITKCRCYKNNRTLKLFDKSWRYPVAKYIKQFSLWDTVTIGYGQIYPEFNRNHRMTLQSINPHVMVLKLFHKWFAIEGGFCYNCSAWP